MAAQAQTNAAKLYTPGVLALSVELAGYPFVPEHPLKGYAKSRTCGSEIGLSAVVDRDGAITELGLTVSACAIGQASAALFAADAMGRSLAVFEQQLAALERWLKDGGPDGIVPRLDLIEPARAYPARHEAILLPWRAAIDALSQAGNSG